MVTMFNDSDYTSDAPHSAALNVVRSERVRAMRVIEVFPLQIDCLLIDLMSWKLKFTLGNSLLCLLVTYLMP